MIKTRYITHNISESALAVWEPSRLSPSLKIYVLLPILIVDRLCNHNKFAKSSVQNPLYLKTSIQGPSYRHCFLYYL